MAGQVRRRDPHRSCIHQHFPSLSLSWAASAALVPLRLSPGHVSAAESPRDLAEVVFVLTSESFCLQNVEDDSVTTSEQISRCPPLAAAAWTSPAAGEPAVTYGCACRGAALAQHTAAAVPVSVLW